MLPLILSNAKQQRVKGVSHLLVSLNILGDGFKLGYLLIKKQPYQFIISAIVQVFLDLFIVMQICYYGKGKPNSKSFHV